MFRIKRWDSFLCVTLAFLLVFSPCLWSRSDEGAKGSVVGFVYDQDGTTPIEGAVVKLRNVTSGKTYESSPSDSEGNFLIEEMESGVYIYGVTSVEGDYSCDGMIGVRVDRSGPAKMSLALSQYDEEKQAKSRANQTENTSDEYLVGEVISYIPGTKMAQVRILRGVLESRDKIHVLGDETDFYQKVNSLSFNGSKVKRLFVDQVGHFEAKKDVKEGDLVYLTKESGLVPFLLSPLGIAALVAGTAAVGYITYSQVTDGAEASPFK